MNITIHLSYWMLPIIVLWLYALVLLFWSWNDMRDEYTMIIFLPALFTTCFSLLVKFLP